MPGLVTCDVIGTRGLFLSLLLQASKGCQGARRPSLHQFPEGERVWRGRREMREFFKEENIFPEAPRRLSSLLIGETESHTSFALWEVRLLSITSRV